MNKPKKIVIYTSKLKRLLFFSNNENKTYENGIGEENVNNVVVSRNYADYSTAGAHRCDHVVVSVASSKFIL